MFCTKTAGFLYLENYSIFRPARPPIYDLKRKRAAFSSERGMKPEISEKGILNLGRHVLLEEAKELEAIAGRLDETFVKAVTLILNCKGRVVVSGVGKSGHIARKIAATLL